MAGRGRAFVSVFHEIYCSGDYVYSVLKKTKLISLRSHRIITAEIYHHFTVALDENNISYMYTSQLLGECLYWKIGEGGSEKKEREKSTM
jgi:hypothetical protein